MDDGLRNIQVFDKDAARLERLFGKPMKRALHMALGTSACVHPEAMRTYTRAMVSGIRPGDAINQSEAMAGLTLNGFYCAACNTCVFPVPETKNEPEPA